VGSGKEVVVIIVVKERARRVALKAEEVVLLLLLPLLLRGRSGDGLGGSRAGGCRRVSKQIVL